jgi:hypothetical protein
LLHLQTHESKAIAVKLMVLSPSSTKTHTDGLDISLQQEGIAGTLAVVTSRLKVFLNFSSNVSYTAVE